VCGFVSRHVAFRAKVAVDIVTSMPFNDPLMGIKLTALSDSSFHCGVVRGRFGREKRIRAVEIWRP